MTGRARDRARRAALAALLLPALAAASFAAPVELDYVMKRGDLVFGEVRATRDESDRRVEMVSDQRVRLSLLGTDQEVRELVTFSMDRVSGTREARIGSTSFFKSRSLEVAFAGTGAVLLDRLTGDRTEFSAGEPIWFCMDYFLGRDLGAIAPGASFAYPVVDVDTGRLETQEVTLLSAADGAFTFRIRRALYDSTETYDAALDLLRARVDSLGIAIERKAAGGPRNGTERFDIRGGDLLEFPSDLPAGEMENALWMRATLAWRDVPPGELSLADARQESRILAAEGGGTTVEVTVARRDLARDFAVRIDRIDTAAVGLYLEPTPLIRSGSPRILAVRDRVIGSERRLDRVVEASCAFVARTVRPEVLPDTLSSDEVLEAGRGMCMQYGILLAALLRSAGVPVRCVMGLKESGGRFLPHLSSEVWNGRRWLPVDATEPAAEQSRLAPNTIRLGHGADLPDLSRLKARLLRNLALSAAAVGR